MLPLVPEEFITDELVSYIVSFWKDANVCDKTAFDPMVKTLLGVYVGRLNRNGRRHTPFFNTRFWSVCGLKIRSNNSAESVHSRLNKKVKGTVSLVRFLQIFEGEMQIADERIATGCKSRANPVEFEKNKLLAKEYSMLVHRQIGTLDFLDNCSRIMFIKNKTKAQSFTPHRSNADPKDPIRAANDALVRSCVRLYRWIVPDGTLSAAETLESVPDWSFKPTQDVAVARPRVDNEFSLVQRGPRTSFLDVHERIAERWAERDEVRRRLVDDMNVVGKPRTRPPEDVVFPGSACASLLEVALNNSPHH